MYACTGAPKRRSQNGHRLVLPDDPGERVCGRDRSLEQSDITSIERVGRIHCRSLPSRWSIVSVIASVTSS